MLQLEFDDETWDELRHLCDLIHEFYPTGDISEEKTIRIAVGLLKWAYTMVKNDYVIGAIEANGTKAKIIKLPHTP